MTAAFEEHGGFGDQPPSVTDAALVASAPPTIPLQPDLNEMTLFVKIVFRHADCGTHINLRGVDEKKLRPARIFPAVAIGAGGYLDNVVAAAIEAARKCAEEGYNFCPPVATFYTSGNAKLHNLACCPVIVADIDKGDIAGGWRLLTAILGPPTIVVASGGVCTRSGQEKLHIYWLLRVPTRTPEEHAQLKRVRAMVAHLAGGDTAAASLVQCFRWAGALHQKTSPRRSRFIELNEDVEADLDEAEAKLREAIEAIDGPGYFAPQSSRFTAGRVEVPLEWVEEAAPFIPNDNKTGWDKWVAMGMAMFAATGGSDEGFEAFVSWSKKRPGKYDYNGCTDRWDHWKKSPPSRTGFGKIAKIARQHGWRGPNMLAGIEVKMPPDGATATASTALAPAPPAPLAAAPALLLNADDVPIANLANALVIIRTSLALHNRFALDEMRQIIVLLPEQRPMTDVDVTRMQEWFQRDAGLVRIAKEVVSSAIELIATDNKFHPVRDHLRSLVWDRIERLNTWLQVYLGAEGGAYPRGIGRMFLIAMVARIMQPGCKVDYVLVLEGDQGGGKSTACAILAGPYFGDSLPDLHHGDDVRLKMYLRGKWLIEIAEMSSFSKAEVGALKAFITEAEDRYIPKYGRTEVVDPRQCVFIGTTNKTTYLRDETGGRRFWPVRTGSIDLASLRRDRDQLLAEAVYWLDQGEVWYPDREFEANHIAPQQESRFEVDEWDTLILGFLARRLGEAEAEAARVTIPEVAQVALRLDARRLGVLEQRRIVAIMRRAGWVDGRTGKGRFWHKPGGADASVTP